jgi:Cupredoxin-like domain
MNIYLRRCALLCLYILTPFNAVHAAPPEFQLEIRDHLFLPDAIRIPADQKVKLVVYNRDPTPEEFESYELNREKVIMGNSKAIIFIGPLKPGEYPFFGEFNPTTALGKVIAE